MDAALFFCLPGTGSAVAEAERGGWAGQRRLLKKIPTIFLRPGKIYRIV